MEAADVLELLKEDDKTFHFYFYLGPDTEHKAGLVSHAPLTICAYYLIGATKQQVIDHLQFYDFQLKNKYLVPLVPALPNVDHETIEDKSWQNYRDYSKVKIAKSIFNYKLKKKGILYFIEENGKYFADGMVSGLFHGWLLVAFGFELIHKINNDKVAMDAWQNEGIINLIAKGLATVHTKDIHFPRLPNTPSATVAQPLDVNELTRLVDEFLASDDWKEIYEEIDENLVLTVPPIRSPLDFAASLSRHDKFNALFLEKLDVFLSRDVQDIH